MHRMIGMTLVLLVLSAASNGQNLLLNPSFDEPAVASSCARDTAAVTNWTNLANRNDTLYIPTCPRDGDGARASVQGWGGVGYPGQTFYQTVNDLTPGISYSLTGYWAMGHMDSWGALTVTAELLDGDSPSSPKLAEAKVVQSQGGRDWQAFQVNATPSGTSMTVLFRWINAGSTGWALHVDGLMLTTTTCFNPPSADTITPDYGVRGTTASVSITGTNFVNGQTTVKLARSGQSDIVASNVVVTGGGTGLTCDFNLGGAPPGRWDVVVSIEGPCAPAVLNNAFLVVLPSLQNASFELPSAPGGCPVTPITGVPTDWLFGEIAEYGYAWALFRDSDRSPPTCPPPDGDHYGSSISDNNGGAGAEAWIYQTVSAIPGTTYTLSGQFAGAGRNTVTLELHDGDLSSPLIGDGSTIHSSTDPAYDWSPAAVSASPTGNYMTAVIHIKLNGEGPHAAHFDKLAIGVCETPISITGMAPLQAVSGGTINATISGSNFAGSPSIQLVKSGQVISATNVNVVSADQITCDFDLSDAGSGKYKLIMLQGACIAEYQNALQVVGASFVNGSFELPTNEQTPCTGEIGGLPTGWSTNAPSGLRRDGQAPPPNPCPSPDGGHYGYMSEGGATTVRAWQTIAVDPGRYRFSGLFNAPLGVTVTLRLLDGDENGIELANSPVALQENAWVSGSVEANAPASGIMTVVWEMTLTGAEPNVGGSADGLKFESSCNDPVFDFDDDGDVDQVDFSVFQVCYTGFDSTLPAGCECADRTGDGFVTQSDATAFEACASGPGIPANADCD